MVESAKEAKNIMDEKVQRITENFAEVRSMVYQREAESKEQEVAMEKLKETVSHVDTSKILAEFSARDEQMRDINTRMERQERNTKMVTGDVSRIKGLMTDIGSLENIMKATKHVGEKLETIQEIENKMKAMFTKLEGVYVDMKKKLDEFSNYKVKADKIDGMVNDLTKNVEEQTRRMSDFVSKSDVDSLKTEIQGMKTEIQKKAAAPVTGAAPVNPQLQSEKEEIEALLATLDENYKSKQMPEEEYKKARESNEAKLAEIENKMKAGAPKPSGSPKEKKEEKMEHRRVEMLSKLRESYENGEISRRAYMKSRKLLLSK